MDEYPTSEGIVLVAMIFLGLLLAFCVGKWARLL